MGAPPFYVFDQLYITFLIFFFSMSVKLKLSRAFNCRVAQIWEGDYHFDGLPG